MVQDAPTLPSRFGRRQLRGKETLEQSGRDYVKVPGKFLKLHKR
jgi:hypothetical protein